MSGIVAIIGRPNVGKSTLFNRLTESRQAIVADESGVTRDRNYGVVSWGERNFTIIDTGGYVPGSEDVFESAIREQVHIAMDEADVLLFMVDGRAGLMPLDEDFANIVRRQPRKVILVVNKADTPDQEALFNDFYGMGFKEIFMISAMNGHNTGDLLDTVVRTLPEEREDEREEKLPRFAVVGRPNVGKSSIVNALLGQDRNMVTDIAGTTRDATFTRYSAFNLDFYLVDTAGLRKKAKVEENVEFYSTLRTVRAIEECDVALLVIDATEGIGAQDLAIVHLIEKHKKGLIILVNKWDLVERTKETADSMEEVLRERLAPLAGIPIIFTSAITKHRILKAMEMAAKVYQNRHVRIPTAELNDVMLAAIAAHHPPTYRGRIIRIKYATQIPAEVPTFLFFCNHPKYVPESYKRYLENRLREAFGFEGLNINIFFREK